jgi:hypothetical protein
VDTATLPPQEAARVEALVAAADFFNIPTSAPPVGPGADRFSYEVTVHADGQQHTVEATEGAMSAPLQQLIEYVLSADRARQAG